MPAINERVFVRPPSKLDRRELLHAVRRSAALHASWVRPPADAAAFDAFLASLGERRASFLICRRDDDAIAGVINISEIVRGVFQSGYLGYYALSPHAGGGLMTDGMRQVVRRAFGAMKLHRLEANIQPENTASIALVRRVGFRREGFSPRYLKINGRWRDHERWAILREDPGPD